MGDTQQERIRKSNGKALAVLLLAFVALLLFLGMMPSAYRSARGGISSVYILCWATIPFTAIICSPLYRNGRTYFCLAAVATLPLVLHFLSDSLTRRLLANPEFCQQLIIYCSCIPFFTGALAGSICWILEKIECPPNLTASRKHRIVTRSDEGKTAGIQGSKDGGKTASD